METQTATQSQTQSENGLERFVRKTRALFAQEPDLDKRWNALRPILAELLADPDVIAASKQWPDCVPANGRAENLLFYEDPDYGFAINGLTKGDARQGGRARIHDHAHIYTLYGVLDGHEKVVRYDRLDDRSKADHAEIRESSNVLVGPGEIDLVKPYEIHTEITVGERTVAVIIRSQKGGEFNQGRYVPEENRYYESLGPRQTRCEMLPKYSRRLDYPDKQAHDLKRETIMARPERIGQSLESIEALIHYLEEGEKPASYGGVRQSVAAQKKKGKYQEHKMTIYNARAIADQLSLEREGFILVSHETKMQNFYDEDEIRDLYYKETEELVKRTSGAKRVVVFDHTLRSANEATREEKQISGPVRHAHNDYTDSSGPQRVRDLLPDEAEELLKRRFAIVQTWRPINKPVQREPLAIADARSIGTKELVASARIYPDRVGETAHMTFNPDHVWYYFPNMQRNEAIVFKTFESERDGRARWTAHCAFDDPTSPPDAPPRESIEMRTLAFF